MISSLFFMSFTGEVLIEKQFREKVPRSSLEDYWNTFMAPLRSIEDAASVTQYSRFVFVQIRRGNVILLAITTQEGSPLMMMEFLDRIASILRVYVKELSEFTLRENFSVVYQLLEELVDNGYPLTTQIHMLDELVAQPTLENKVRSMLDVPKSKGRVFSSQQVAWRDPATKHSSNEILFDVVELMDAIVSSEGNITHIGIRGSIEANCRLSGMPDVMLRLRNADVLDDVAFHRCVRISQYDIDRVLSFIPPDGRFTLMEYKCKPLPNIIPPFYVTPQISFASTGGRINCMVGIRSGGPGSLATGAEVQRAIVHIPLPPQTDNIRITTCTQGTYSFSKATNTLTWSLGTLGRMTPSLSGEFSFINGAGVEEVTPYTGETVSVEFQMPNRTHSGIHVDSVNIMNDTGKIYKGVKYITKEGRFCVRTV